MGQDVKNQTRFCQIPHLMNKTGFSMISDRREIIVAASLITVLAISSLLTYVLWPPVFEPRREDIPPSFITIDGDSNFSATALLEGWLGDGSPENPYIIDGLDLDLADFAGCIRISNTRVSFIISNCILTASSVDGQYPFFSGIGLENVTNGEIVNNTCNNNAIGIFFHVG